MTEPGTLARIVHGVGQVARKHDLHSESNLLPNPKRPAQYAHIRVNAHERDILDLLLAEHIPNHQSHNLLQEALLPWAA